MFITAGPMTKLFAGGGGGEWRTSAMRDDKPRPQQLGRVRGVVNQRAARQLQLRQNGQDLEPISRRVLEDAYMLEVLVN